MTLEIQPVSLSEANATHRPPSTAQLAALRLPWGTKGLITYTMESESGASLRGAGWREIGRRKGRSWNCPSRPRVDKSPLQAKILWEAA